MWLEEMVWLWLPVAGGVGLWVIRSMIALRTEVRALRKRLDKVEAEAFSRINAEQTVGER